eukprot:gene20323-biopygen2563
MTPSETRPPHPLAAVPPGTDSDRNPRHESGGPKRCLCRRRTAAAELTPWPYRDPIGDPPPHPTAADATGHRQRPEPPAQVRWPEALPVPATCSR